jgi:hypothetical protein
MQMGLIRFCEIDITWSKSTGAAAGAAGAGAGAGGPPCGILGIRDSAPGEYTNEGGCIFYTLNGRFIGMAFTRVVGSLHPVVGVDTSAAIYLNFGGASGGECGEM